MYASLLLSILFVSNWYNHHLVSYTLLQHPQWIPPLPTESTLAAAPSMQNASPRNDIEPTIDVATNSASIKKLSVPMIQPDVDDPIDIGILSSLDGSYFHNVQRELDEMVDPHTRCQRYNYQYDSNISGSTTTPRRIFYGSLIADESFELLNIIAAETYQIYTGMVFVESNRTQSFIHTREWKHVDTGTNTDVAWTHRRQKMMASLFGLEDFNQVRIKPFINENKNLQSLYREHKQRDLIIQGWKQLGMQPDDIGIIADLDETFSRDFLRAIQTCSDIPQFQYHNHHCHHESVKIVAKALVYESSPQCRTVKRYWFHPDIIIGHCIEGIGDAKIHPSAPREDMRSFVRAPGYGQNCDDWYNESRITNHQYPSWNAADFRRTCSGGQEENHKYHTGYHFHNFFIHMNTTRYKYFSYGHADTDVYQKPIYEMSNDSLMMYNCVNELPDAVDQKWKRSVLDFENETLDPLVEPIYFMDRDYRQRRHEHVHVIVKEDDEMLAQLMAPAASPHPTVSPNSVIPKQEFQEQQYSAYFDMKFSYKL